ncbi:IctB family putative bicarbonate transporter [cf. Phormidesmis sp. LEGE 11477]|uniref:IctB family putative bicarbonate transporter n=1 Tax=cf. Phormidesmis sp. LEGE 11477 TaxID=1828680 RepID=UPI00187F548B|nr:IctB family putative bicarbonate transporter [cf. Phormidesmis sp. LEGE 11477]MBE9060610.1 putative bicarbonate transporter, IctB family [cf. Phormidesmis sp. LEGE 11477]
MFGINFSRAARPITSGLTLDRFAFHQWREVSYLHRLLSPLRDWRHGSWLLAWGDGIAWVFVAAMIALAPYVSTTLIGWLLLASAGLWFLLTVSDQAEGWLTPLHIAVVAYWGAMVLATALSPVKGAALSGLIKLTLNVLLFMLTARILRIKELRSGLVLVYLATATIVSAYGLRQWFFGAEALATWVDPESNLSGATRVYSYLKNPNLLAGYLMPAIGFGAMAMFAWQRWLPKLLAAIVTLVSSSCLVLTLSRGGWLGFLAIAFVMMVLLVFWGNSWFSPFWRRWALPLLLVGSAVVVVAAVVVVPQVRERVVSIFAMRGDSSNNFRLNVYAAVFDMIRARPLVGIGPGNEAFNQVYPLYQRTGYTALSAYSIYFETLVEGGIVAGLALLWMLILAFQQGWSQLGRLRETLEEDGYWLMGAIAAMAGLLVQGTFDTVWYRPQISTLWWMLLGIVASFYAEKRKRKLLPSAEMMRRPEREATGEIL